MYLLAFHLFLKQINLDFTRFFKVYSAIDLFNFVLYCIYIFSKIQVYPILLFPFYYNIIIAHFVVLQLPYRHFILSIMFFVNTIYNK